MENKIILLAELVAMILFLVTYKSKCFGYLRVLQHYNYALHMYVHIFVRIHIRIVCSIRICTRVRNYINR